MRALVSVFVVACGFQPGVAPTPTSDSRAVDTPVPHDAAIDSRMADAAIDLCPTSTCAANNGTCVGGVCKIVKNGMGNVTCPNNVPCVITCANPAACNAIIDCAKASTCTIDCTADNSCGGVFECMQTSCTLYCRGVGSCSNCQIDDTTKSCDIECCGTGSCTNALATPSACTGTQTCP